MFYEVIPTEIFRTGGTVLTYSSPISLKPGHIVLVPLGPRLVTGVVKKHVKSVDFPVKPVSRLLHPLPLPTHLLKAANWLSNYGGQAERACAARAMFMHPEIILADEPTNNLDPENAKNVIEMLKQIQQETGATMIVASHDPLVEKYATQIVNIREGRVNTTSADESKDAQEGE